MGWVYIEWNVVGWDGVSRDIRTKTAIILVAACNLFLQGNPEIVPFIKPT